MSNRMTETRTVVSNAEFIADEDGGREWFGIAGHYPSTVLLRVAGSHIGDVFVVLEAYWSVSDRVTDQLRRFCKDVTQGWWYRKSMDNPADWEEVCDHLTGDVDSETVCRECGAEPYWPWEWDYFFVPCAEDHAKAEPATYWDFGKSTRDGDRRVAR